MATGDDIVAIAKKHLKERYVLGARAPMANAAWKGPWDCAEFASWCLYQATGVLFGTEPDDDPIRADAFTGYWSQQSRAANARVPVEEAAAIVGAFVLRAPASGKVGHIVISDGAGGTIEAHSAARGVVTDTLDGRRWDTGVLPPGVTYFRGPDPVIVAPPPAGILRVTDPLTKGKAIEKVQRALVKAGFFPGKVDGIYGPQTASAVVAFQAANGLVADGEVGPATRAALGIA